MWAYLEHPWAEMVPVFWGTTHEPYHLSEQNFWWYVALKKAVFGLAKTIDSQKKWKTQSFFFLENIVSN